MASELAAYYVSIVGSARGLTKSISKEFAGVSREASKSGKSSGSAFTSAFKGSMAGIASALSVGAIVGFVGSAVKGAGDIEQSFGALDSVFGGSSAQMKAWSKDAAKSVGLTSNEFNELGTLIGAQLKNGGTAMDKLGPKTNELIGLGADLSSMFGGSAKEAVEALSSALKGERDPIERYGVSLNQAKIDAEAAALGFDKVGGSLSAEANQAATMSLIMKQTTAAHGNFAKESDTFAHKQQVMAAEWGNLTTKMGELFLPTITTVFAFISDKVIPALTEGVGGIRAFGAAFKAADGDITSNGFPGFMERLAAGAHGLHDLLINGDYRGLLYTAFGWEEDSPIVGFLLDLRDGVIKTKDALVEAGDWVVRNNSWLSALAVTVGSVVVAYKTYTTALAVHAATVALYTAVTTAAGGAQAFFAGAAFTAALGMTALNTVLKANLFGIIAFAIIGLVSGLVWFFTQTEAGKDIVKNVWAFIQSVIGGVVDWFTNTALPAIQDFIGGIVGFFEDMGGGIETAVQGVGGVFTWLHDSVIKPVFDGVASVIGWVYNSIIKPVFDGISTAVNWVGGVFTAFYESTIKPVFDSIGVIVNGFYLGFRGIFQLVVAVINVFVIPAIKYLWDRFVEGFTAIGNTISDWWKFAAGIFNGAVGFVRDVFGPVFTWLRDTIGLVFAVVSALIGVWWTNVRNNFSETVSFVRDVLGAVFTWLRDSIVKPVFDGIGAAISWVWNNVVKPVFDNWVWLFNNVLGPAVTWLYETVIKPAFEGIGSAIGWVWDNILKPVFTALSDFIQKTIPKAFEDGVAFVKTAWDRLGEIAKSPIRFIIDTVINDGLIGAFNTVAGMLPGVDKLPRVALPPGFAEGGYTGPGGKYQPAGIVHAGEVVWSQKDIARWGGVGVVEGMRKAAGYAGGGIVNPLKQMALTQGYNRVHKGIDLAAGVGTPVFATEGGTVSWAGPGATAPGVWGGNEVHVNGGSGIQTWFAHLSRIMVGIGEQVRAGQQIALSGNTGISSGPHLHFGTFAGGWPNDVDPLGYLGGAGIPSGGVGGGFNPIAGIIDGLMGQFKNAFPAGGALIDLIGGVGKKILTSAADFITGIFTNSSDGNATGIRPTLYDGGGWLENTGGAQLIQHNKAKPDAVLSNEQWQTMAQIARNSENTGSGIERIVLDVGGEQVFARIVRAGERKLVRA